MNFIHQPNPTTFGCTLLSAMGTEGATGRGSMLLLCKNRWLKGDVIHTSLIDRKNIWIFKILAPLPDSGRKCGLSKYTQHNQSLRFSVQYF